MQAAIRLLDNLMAVEPKRPGPVEVRRAGAVARDGAVRSSLCFGVNVMGVGVVEESACAMWGTDSPDSDEYAYTSDQFCILLWRSSDFELYAGMPQPF